MASILLAVGTLGLVSIAFMNGNVSCGLIVDCHLVALHQSMSLAHKKTIPLWKQHWGPSTQKYA